MNNGNLGIHALVTRHYKPEWLTSPQQIRSTFSRLLSPTDRYPGESFVTLFHSSPTIPLGAVKGEGHHLYHGAGRLRESQGLGKALTPPEPAEVTGTDKESFGKTNQSSFLFTPWSKWNSANMIKESYCITLLSAALLGSQFYLLPKYFLHVLQTEWICDIFFTYPRDHC